MQCAYCGSNESNVKRVFILAEGGLAMVPVCPVDEILADESFGRPVTEKFAGMQAVI